jgi:hypothetical protein
MNVKLFVTFYDLHSSYQKISHGLYRNIIRQVSDTPLLAIFVKIRRHNLYLLLSFLKIQVSLCRIEYDVFVFGCPLHSPGLCFDNTNLHGSNIYNDLFVHSFTDKRRSQEHIFGLLIGVILVSRAPFIFPQNPPQFQLSPAN